MCLFEENVTQAFFIPKHKIKLKIKNNNNDQQQQVPFSPRASCGPNFFKRVSGKIAENRLDPPPSRSTANQGSATVAIDGSKGTLGTRTPYYFNFFHFHKFLAKILPNRFSPKLRGWRPSPLGKFQILDPPLVKAACLNVFLWKHMTNFKMRITELAKQLLSYLILSYQS